MAAVPIPNPLRTQAQHLLSTIGNTPLLRLEKIGREFPGVEIYAKAEYFNPGGSVKDRAGLNMILDGERTGRLHPEHIILDATSGNTGIAYAMIGAATAATGSSLCLPANASIERKRILKAYGAEMVFSDPGRRLRWRHPPVPRNLRGRSRTSISIPTSTTTRPTGRAHFETTGPEIIEQTSGLHHPFRGRHGHQRHVHRRQPPPASRSAAREMLFRRSHLQRLSWPGGIEAHAHRHRARHLRPTLADGNIWIETEEAYAHGAAPGARRGAAGGHFVRMQRGRRAP